MRVHLTMDAVAQTAHFFISTTLILATYIAYPKHGQLIGSVVTVAWAAFKEGYWDPRHEDPTTQGSGLWDFSWYMVGWGAANAFILIKEAL